MARNVGRSPGVENRAGLYPSIDLERSSSRLLTDPRLEETHRTVVSDARGCFRTLAANGLPNPQQLTWLAPDDRAEADALFARAVRLDRFLTQPYHGTEMWMGEPGETVALADTVEGVRQILSGEHDEVPEEAFQYVGTISQALEKAERL